MPDLFLVRVKQKSGFMDGKGKVVIPPTYQWASDFSEGFAFVGHYDPEGRKNRYTGGV